MISLQLRVVTLARPLNVSSTAMIACVIIRPRRSSFRASFPNTLDSPAMLPHFLSLLWCKLSPQIPFARTAPSGPMFPFGMRLDLERGRGVIPKALKDARPSRPPPSNPPSSPPSGTWRSSCRAAIVFFPWCRSSPRLQKSSPISRGNRPCVTAEAARRRVSAVGSSPHLESLGRHPAAHIRPDSSSERHLGGLRSSALMVGNGLPFVGHGRTF